MTKLRFDGQVFHFGAVRYRITGAGNFLSTLFSLDNVQNYPAPNITLATSQNKEPTILTNFNQERAYLEGQMSVINDNFVISRIIIYIRQVATGYPQ